MFQTQGLSNDWGPEAEVQVWSHLGAEKHHGRLLASAQRSSLQGHSLPHAASDSDSVTSLSPCLKVISPHIFLLGGLMVIKWGADTCRWKLSSYWLLLPWNFSCSVFHMTWETRQAFLDCFPYRNFGSPSVHLHQSHLRFSPRSSPWGQRKVLLETSIPLPASTAVSPASAWGGEKIIQLDCTTLIVGFHPVPTGYVSLSLEKSASSLHGPSDEGDREKRHCETRHSLLDSFIHLFILSDLTVVYKIMRL